MYARNYSSGHQVANVNFFHDIFNHFYVVRPGSYTEFGEITQNEGNYAVQGHVTNFDTNRKPIYDFLLVINTNLPSVLRRFRDIAFDRSKIAVWPPVLRLTPSKGTISVKFSVDVSGWQRYQMALKIC